MSVDPTSPKEIRSLLSRALAFVEDDGSITDGERRGLAEDLRATIDLMNEEELVVPRRKEGDL